MNYSSTIDIQQQEKWPEVDCGVGGSCFFPLALRLVSVDVGVPLKFGK